MTCAAAPPPDGPRWVPNAAPGSTRQTDGRGVLWVVERVEQGGRVIRWWALFARRGATTEITPDHPQYPSDAAVLAAARAERKAERARWR